MGARSLAASDGSVRFPILHNALAAALRARLVVTIPGTKTIELAVLGVPTITITPLNAPEMITFNGPLTYLDRIPLVGVPLKRAAAVGVSRRFKFHTQPNMDADESLVCELHGTVTPGASRASRWNGSTIAPGSRAVASAWPRSMPIMWARRTAWPNRSSARRFIRLAYDAHLRHHCHQGSRRVPRARARVARGADRCALIRADRGRQRLDATTRRPSSKRQAARGTLSGPVRLRSRAQSRKGAQPRRRASRAATSCSSVDDDVQLPPGFLAAHEAAHAYRATSSSTARSSTSRRTTTGRSRRLANYSRAFLCTCNVSLPKHAIDAVGGFDEAFHLYGWEDTELGVRLREAGVRWRFAWDAYLWHIKSPTDNTLEVETRKAIERARMARHFLDKQASPRSAHGDRRTPGELVARTVFAARLAACGLRGHRDEREGAGAGMRSLARAQFLDGMYTRELVRVLDELASA